MRVLAIFCNPKRTVSLRLQNEQRVLQQSLRSSSAELEVVPAATLDDVRSCMLGKKFDVIHFSGHGCVDGPLQALVKHKQVPSECTLPAVAALRRWLLCDDSWDRTSEGDEGGALCTLVVLVTHQTLYVLHYCFIHRSTSQRPHAYESLGLYPVYRSV